MIFRKTLGQFMTKN